MKSPRNHSLYLLGLVVLTSLLVLLCSPWTESASGTIQPQAVQPGNLVISNAGLNAIQEVDSLTRTIVQTLPLPVPYVFSDPPMLLTTLVRTNGHNILVNARDSSGNPVVLALTNDGQFVAEQPSGGGWLQQIVFDPLDQTQNTILGGVPFIPEIRAINPFAATVNTRISGASSNFIGIATNALGQIYAGDFNSGQVNLYDSNGVLQSVFANVGASTGSNEINGMARDTNGNIYVAQNSSNRIAKFNNAGAFVTFLTHPSFNRVISVLFNPNDGLLYIGNFNDGHLSILTTSGAEVAVINLGGRHIGVPGIVPSFIAPDPVVTITSPPSGAMFAVGTAVDFTGAFTDACGGTHTATWMFDTIIQVGTVNEFAGTVTATHTFTAPGVYLVKLTVDSSCGGSGIATTVDGLTAMVVVYDPNGGFVTGGGWINSPVGAYQPDPSLTGKANFGFVSKYQPGATVPTGQTEFRFKVANLNFQSAIYEWLVVAGARAQYKGTGTINGAGNYGFMLMAIDGQVNGGGVDKFRIKIWDNNNGEVIVYDNKIGSASNSNDATELGGGSIIIHK